MPSTLAPGLIRPRIRGTRARRRPAPLAPVSPSLPACRMCFRPTLTGLRRYAYSISGILRSQEPTRDARLGHRLAAAAGDAWRLTGLVGTSSAFSPATRTAPRSTRVQHRPFTAPPRRSLAPGREELVFLKHKLTLRPGHRMVAWV